MDQHLLAVALGTEPADLVITNGQLVNVYSGETYPGGVAVAGDRIAAVGDVAYTIGAGTTVIDAGGKYLTPGFIDGHIHPESANLSLSRFAEVALSHGTTAVFTDLHEIGVVGGIEAMSAALEEGKQTPLKFYWLVPSHIPFSPGVETSGGHIDAGIIEQAMARSDAHGLSEVVSVYVAMGLPDLMRSLDITREQHKVISGHAPETHGPAWNAFVAAGATNDHEALSADEIVQRVRSGVNAQLRHNLVVPTMPALVPAVKSGIDTRMLSLATDDTTAVVLANEGHMDYLVRLVLEQGVPLVTAIQMATLNVAQAFHKDFEIGALAPGRYADINIVDGPEQFRVLKTIAGGTLVAEDLRPVAPLPLAGHDPILLNTFHLKRPVTAGDLVIPARAGAKSAHVSIMRTLPWVPITEGGEADLPVKDGYIAADTAQDLLHIAVIERHHQTGNIGRAFLGGMGLKRGAMASSIGHDHHNIVALGTNPEDMAVAANRVAELQGGIVLVDGGRVIDEIPLPILGLLTDVDAWTLAKQRQALLAKAAEMGCAVSDAFMFLSFITLAAIPAFAITDKGYVDVIKQAIVDPVLSYR
ncbi:MAG TPA: adenine deaminase C-terminal domain-containing protein [Anaerolineae bacterium]|nr:adenine deaminase C-terminal domain-containing protein [Anaerolineae bacterium]HOR00539.1 adenine deaminase C-terminal domain-containing protein [Anaerolineae bacterium]